jgi:HD-like signal output (HDOD) protein
VTLRLEELPPLSPLAPTLLSVDSEDPNAERVILRVAASEPILGARLMAVANSAAFAAAGAKSTTIGAAVRRIGLRRSLQLAIAQLFGSTMQRKIPPALNQVLWLHSLAIAYATQEVARLKAVEDAGGAYFLGLMHNLGYVAMETLRPGTLAQVAVEAVAANISLEQAEARVFGVDHAEATAELLRFWKLPEDMVAPILCHHALDQQADSKAAILFGAEKIARWEDVEEPLYHGLEHPFRSLAMDRIGIDFLFDQHLELGSDDVTKVGERIVAQVDVLQQMATAMTAAA